MGKGPGYDLQEDIKERLLLGKFGGRELMVHFDLIFVIIKESRLKKILESRKVIGSIKDVISRTRWWCFGGDECSGKGKETSS